MRIQDIAVIGLGSPHGDDQLGWQVISYLEKDQTFSACCFQVTHPLEIIDLIQEKRGVIVVDACRSGSLPGSVHRLVWPDSRIEGMTSISSHGINVSESVRLAEQLGRIPEIVVFGVEIDEIRIGHELSTLAMGRVPAITRQIMQEAYRMLEKL